MKIKRIGVVAAAAAAATALALTGCTSTSPKSEIKESTSVTIAQNGPVSSLNQLVANQYSTYNGNPAALFNASFTYFNNQQQLVDNTKFGTYKEVSTNPLTIQYHINKGVDWSDGDPVNAADILLQWASSISKYNDPKGKVNFGSVNAGSGLDNITAVPTVSDNGQTVTAVFSKPYVDWKQALLSPALPAHVVYQEAFPTKNTSNSDADAAVIKAIQGDDQTTLAGLAGAWSTKWNVASMPSDKKLLVVDGAYQITDFVKNQYVTLALRSGYKAGPGNPSVDKITIRFISDPTAQVQALQNGEVNIISGQATTDTLSALKQVKNVKISNSPEASYEHVDLVVNNKGPFSPATYGGGTAGTQKAQLVREAYLKALPRQEIVDKLIKPLNPSATLDDSQMFLPGSAGYNQSVANNGSSAYSKVDISAAKQLLQQAGVSAPTVRFAYPSDNPRRVSEFQLIQASEAQAGFKVVGAPKSTTDFFNDLPTTNWYDTSIFAWQYTSLALTGNQAAFQTGGASNYNGYSNKSVDADWQKLETSTGSAADNNALLAAIDKQVWSDAYGATLFQFPDVTAWSSNISGVSDNPLTPNVFWNYFNWKVGKKS
ncbi:ABC transporter family substrate-binding protein [Gryllotalpicola reticulitermitis]|uniref:ABC transporter family substrate-binding protein n=1 Tax=Gryllotalpicola reticulitermitis TaxID=1184153 RepID=A0ABV8Q343_9MICO